MRHLASRSLRLGAARGALQGHLIRTDYVAPLGKTFVRFAPTQTPGARKPSPLALFFTSSPIVLRQALPQASDIPAAGPARRSTLASPLGTSAAIATAIVAISSLLTWTLLPLRAVQAEAPPDDHATPATPSIPLAEVQKHDRNSERPWVIRGSRVYDITDWIPSHPGGEVILQAAGGSIDEYWNIFQIHHKQYVYDILEQYFVGVIDPADLVNGEVPADHIDDPFKDDPQRDARMIMLTERPCNAETPGEVLNDHLTPNEVFYVRNHFWVPKVIGDDDYKITIELFDGEERDFTLKQLKTRFKEHTVTAVLQCSGNRRAHMSALAGDTQGLPWDTGAIGNADWSGVLLRDVLRDVGVDVNDPPEEIKHVHFTGSEAYAASIPMAKAVDRCGDVLLAFSMNGDPLPEDHGAPLRVLVPGHVAARSVKWVSRITLSDEESQSQWQQRDYRCFGPNVRKNPDWNTAPSIQEMPVQSAVTAIRGANGEADDVSAHVTLDSKLQGNMVVLEGYAYSGGGRSIVRVDVSADGGRSWNQARLLASPGKGSKAWWWQRWEYAVPADAAAEGFLVKAVDEAYNTQPEGYGPNWNFRGNLTSSWHRVTVSSKPEGAQETGCDARKES